MNDDRSLERAARSWLEAGPTQAPDRAVEAALLLIETTPQERDLRVSWRLPKMTSPARVATAAVIGVLAVGGAFFVFSKPGQPAVSGPGPSPTATTPAPPTTSPSQPLDYTRLQGWIVFEHFGQAPDGSTSVMDTDRRQIWLVKADGSGLHELAPGQPVDGKASPNISPDGTKVLFDSWKPRNLVWEVGVDGGTPRLISTDCSGLENDCSEGEPSYSPDGNRIAVIRWKGAGASATSIIAIRDITTGKLTSLAATSVAGKVGFIAHPTWSPDGRQIAYHRNTQGVADPKVTATAMFIVNADGTGIHQLATPDSIGARTGDPEWSPDGSAIVFSTLPIRESEGVAGHGAVYSIHPDGTGLQELCGACDLGGVAPSWTPDGKHVLYWGYRTWNLMDPDGGNQAPINKAKLTFFGDQLGFGYVAVLQPTQ